MNFRQTEVEEVRGFVRIMLPFLRSLWRTAVANQSPTRPYPARRLPRGVGYLATGVNLSRKSSSDTCSKLPNQKQTKIERREKLNGRMGTTRLIEHLSPRGC